MADRIVSQRAQWKALFIVNVKNSLRNKRVLALATYFPVLFIVVGIVVSKTTSGIYVNVGEQTVVPIIPQMLNYTDRQLLLPYVFDDAATWSSVWSNSLYPQLKALFPMPPSAPSSAAPNWTQFSALQNIADYQHEQNLLVVQNKSAVVQRPTAGYELDLLQLNSAGQLDLGYTILYNDGQFSVPVMANAMNLASANLPGNDSNPSQFPFVNITAGLKTFPSLASEQFDFGTLFIPSFMTMSLAFVSTTFAQALVMEREAGQRMLLTVQGIPGPIYFLAAFCRDIIIYLVPLILDIILLYATQIPVFTNTSPLPWLLLGIFAGPPIILQSYLLSFLFKKASAVGPILGIFQAVLVFAPYFIVTFATNGRADAWVVYLLTIVLTPTFGLQIAFRRLCEAQVNHQAYTSLDTFDPSKAVLGTWLCLIAAAVLYAFLVIYIDYRMFQKRSPFFFMRKLFSSSPQQTATPDDQRNEVSVLMNDDEIGNDVDRKRVEDAVLVQETNRLRRRELTEDDEVVVQGLSKTFVDKSNAKKDIKVLEDLWMSVKTKECFGYLGPNGAGKTTTIKILTGQETATSGTAQISSHSIIPFSSAIPPLIGVCPQESPVWELLTAREHLRFYAKARGLPAGALETEIDRVINEMSIGEVADRRAKEYSGGNLRRLMLGIAIVGAPAIVFLDEPTTGVDVAVRQSIWTVIKELKKRCSVVLTTHSMEEADALCDRIGIIVNGRLQALGTPQRLKNVYGAGYKLLVKTRTPQTTPALIHIIQNEFSGAKLVQSLGSRIEFEILKEDEGDNPSTSSTEARTESAKKTTRFLARLFDVLQRERGRQEIVDYSVSQTSLAQVFIEFAKEQKIL
ncbi:hypothetical protein BC936DRAFT_145658 [Jimgerdemannia flammicorona]|uniref:ABC transporter domain-containing protein n=1 Tax=Jimgerdemannia flammicorona TaxID=994334 RepID=A0A433D9H8_9FUNG|nr:hypothetical protein BC936DRAFT_145658 [Jimgerdemannia flammicorona]